MKDPLQLSENAYEVLLIDPDGLVDNQLVARQFKLKEVFTRKNAREARNTLVNPLSRALVDVFIFENRFLAKLSEKICREPQLLVSRRGDIRRGLENKLTEMFPYYPCIYTLAVLSYWEAVYLEEKRWAGLEQADFPQPAGLGQLIELEKAWTDTVLYWAALINSKDFWLEWLELKKENGLLLDQGHDIPKLQQAISDHLGKQINSYSERYRLAGRQAEALFFSDSSAKLSNEIRSGSVLAALEIRESFGSRSYLFACGPGLLQKYSQIEKVKNAIRAARLKQPQNQDLQELEKALSPLAGIYDLLKEGKLDRAKEELNKIDPAAVDDSELNSCRMNLAFKQGSQAFSVGREEDGFQFWKECLYHGQLNDEQKAGISRLVLEKVKSLQLHEPQKAISMLERVLNIFPDREMSGNLSLLLMQRGIGAYNNGIQEIDGLFQHIHQSGSLSWPDDGPFKASNFLQASENSINDLTKALSLDPGNQKIMQELHSIKSGLQNIGKTLIKLSIQNQDYQIADNTVMVIIRQGLSDPEFEQLCHEVEYNRKFMPWMPKPFSPGAPVKQVKQKKISSEKLPDLIDREKCFFCLGEKNDGRENARLELDFHKTISNDENLLHWQSQKLFVSRCPKCAEVHQAKKEKKDPLAEAKGEAAGCGCLAFIFNGIILYFLVYLFVDFHRLFGMHPAFIGVTGLISLLTAMGIIFIVKRIPRNGDPARKKAMADFMKLGNHRMLSFAEVTRRYEWYLNTTADEQSWKKHALAADIVRKGFSTGLRPPEAGL